MFHVSNICCVSKNWIPMIDMTTSIHNIY